jgi:farnesyl diphosphate synthase
MSSARDAFTAAFPAIAASFVEECSVAHEMPAAATDWIAKMLDYTCVGGKMSRALLVVSTLNRLNSSSEDTPLSAALLEDAHAVGWCIELLQAYFLVADDVMDNSEMRRGQPCWYRRPEVGLIAVNDAFLLKSCLFHTLRRRFRARPAMHAALIELFNQVTLQTELGQLLDLQTQPPNGRTNLAVCDATRYASIVKYKTAFYTIWLPVAGALILAEKHTPDVIAVAHPIAMRIGEFFQVQDDFLDCYGDYATLGKIGTDIIEGKCSWLCVTALQRLRPAAAGDAAALSCAGSPTQERAVAMLASLTEHYGINERQGAAADAIAAHEAEVKALFAELELEAAYRTYEETSRDEIQALIDAQADSDVLPCGMAIYQDILAKLYGRDK